MRSGRTRFSIGISFDSLVKGDNMHEYDDDTYLDMSNMHVLRMITDGPTSHKTLYDVRYECCGRLKAVRESLINDRQSHGARVYNKAIASGATHEEAMERVAARSMCKSCAAKKGHLTRQRKPISYTEAEGYDMASLPQWPAPPSSIALGPYWIRGTARM